MVLRSSPWESRTSLTNKGHFASRGGAGRPPFCVGHAVHVLQLEPSARSAHFVFIPSFSLRLGSTLKEPLDGHPRWFFRHSLLR